MPPMAPGTARPRPARPCRAPGQGPAAAPGAAARSAGRGGAAFCAGGSCGALLKPAAGRPPGCMRNGPGRPCRAARSLRLPAWSGPRGRAGCARTRRLPVASVSLLGREAFGRTWTVAQGYRGPPHPPALLGFCRILQMLPCGSCPGPAASSRTPCPSPAAGRPCRHETAAGDWSVRIRALAASAPAHRPLAGAGRRAAASLNVHRRNIRQAARV